MTLPIRTLAVAAALLVTGCTVGPDYHGAPEVAGEALRTGGTFAHAGEGVEAHAPGVARWWTTLGDAQLTALIDDARRENAFGLMMSLNMLIEFGDAFDFTGSDFRGWCTQVGFRETRIIPLTPNASAAVAYK